jgi:hypothetical protein
MANPVADAFAQLAEPVAALAQMANPVANTFGHIAEPVATETVPAADAVPTEVVTTEVVTAGVVAAEVVAAEVVTADAMPTKAVTAEVMSATVTTEVVPATMTAAVPAAVTGQGGGDEEEPHQSGRCDLVSVMHNASGCCRAVGDGGPAHFRRWTAELASGITPTYGIPDSCDVTGGGFFSFSTGSSPRVLFPAKERPRRWPEFRFIPGPLRL